MNFSIFDVKINTVMKRVLLILSALIFISNTVFSASGEVYLSCTINTVLRMPDMVSSPIGIQRYFYLNNALKKVYDKSHKLVVSEYENGAYTIHLREDDRTERLIYNTKDNSVILFGKQRRGRYYPWIGYNGKGTCSTGK